MNAEKSYEMYVYSEVPEVTVGKLKQGEYPRDVDISSVVERMETQEIAGTVEGSDEHHRKLQLIPTKPYIMYSQGDRSLLDKPALAIV